MNLKERKAIIAGNWKLNKRVAEIPAFTQELQANLPAERCCDVVICAPYPLIAALETAGQGCHLGVGAQDVSEHQHGAFTGEVSAEQLSDLGAQYCIVGHSERRSYHGETDLQVNAKTKILLDNSITPIICVGESLAQREHDHDVFHPSKFYGQHRRSARAQWAKLPVVSHKHTTSGRRLQSHGRRSDLNNY